MISKHIDKRCTLIKRILITVTLSAIIQNCSSALVGYEKNTTESQRNQIHKVTPRPVIAENDVYISNTEEAYIKLPPEILLEWLVNVPLEKVLPGTDDIARVLRTDLLSDGWGYPTSRRRVELEDGNTALEELIAYKKGRHFQYVVWNFTNNARFATNYAFAEFRIVKTDQGSHLIWTYNFQKKGWIRGLLLHNFVKKHYKEFMKTSMQKISELSIQENRPYETDLQF